MYRQTHIVTPWAPDRAKNVKYLFSPVVVCCPACWRGLPPSWGGQRLSTGTGRWSPGPMAQGWPGAAAVTSGRLRPAPGSRRGGMTRQRCRTGAWAGPAMERRKLLNRLNGPVNKSICDSWEEDFASICHVPIHCFKIGNPDWKSIPTRTFLPLQMMFCFGLTG